MFNRIPHLTGPPAPEPEAESYGDFFVVSGRFGAVSVTAGTASGIGEALNRRRPPRWITFQDRSGSKVCVRTRDVWLVCESTAAQRAYDRRMARARDREQRADEAWDGE